MLKKLIIGLASAGALTAAALTPAFADVNYCMDHPNANTCPYGAGAVDESPQSLSHQAHLFHGRYNYQRQYEQTKA
jgi:hypothetical protein